MRRRMCSRDLYGRMILGGRCRAQTKKLYKRGTKERNNGATTKLFIEYFLLSLFLWVDWLLFVFVIFFQLYIIFVCLV